MAPPATNPSGAAAPNRLMTMFFLGPGAYPRPIMAWPFGTSSAAPTPCMARQAMKKAVPPPDPRCTYSLKPPASSHRPSQMNPMTKTLLCPKMSPSRPDGRTNDPEVRP